MRKLFFIALVLASIPAFSQSTKDFLVGGGLDLLKSDYEKPFNKAQFGLEGHYFIVRQFAIGAGMELWTTRQSSSFMMGVRWYPTDKLFVRFRGLIGANDAAAGVGWSQPLKNSFRLEGMGDFYINSTEFALRLGVAYVIKSK